jgi:hypothetical protein
MLGQPSPLLDHPVFFQHPVKRQGCLGLLQPALPALLRPVNADRTLPTTDVT